MSLTYNQLLQIENDSEFMLKIIYKITHGSQLILNKSINKIHTALHKLIYVFIYC
jgi:hypothetical protein